jgi:hypothetical protein
MAITTNPDTLFTEYWPSSPASGPDVDVTIQIAPLVGTNLGVIEESTGLVCQASKALTACTWRVSPGQQLRLVPFRSSGIQYSNAKWSAGPPVVPGGPCAGAYANGTPTACTLTAQQGLAVGLYDYELL